MASTVRPRVFLDIQIGTDPAGRITIELFNDHTPKTCENFRALCTGEKGPELSYKSSIFHRVIDEFMLQGGDITRGDGKGGKSIYGDTFEDEALNWRSIDAEGLVCMANRGPNTNSSQFFITLAPCDHLNGKHTVFGHVVNGMPIVQKIGSVKTNKQDLPLVDVIISHAGELEFKRASAKKGNNGAGTHSSTPSKRRRSKSRSRSRNRDRSRSREHRRTKHRDSDRDRDRDRDRERDREKRRDHDRHRERDRDGERKSRHSKQHDDDSGEHRDRHHHHHHHRRRRHSRSRSRGAQEESAPESRVPRIETDGDVEMEDDTRGRTPKPRGRSITPQPRHGTPTPPKDRHRSVSPSRSHSPTEAKSRKQRSPRRRRSRSTTPSRHRDRRAYRSRSRTHSPPDRSGYRDHRDRRGWYDEEEERRIQREEMEREGGRLGYMDGGSSAQEPESGIKFKGRGSMKFREKKKWRS